MKYRHYHSAAKLKKLFGPIAWLLPLTGFAQGHFVFKANTEDSYAIVVQAATLNGVPLEFGDEIGVFTPAGLCVGATVVRSVNNIPITAWQDDSITPGVEDGYDDGQAITYRVWDASNQAEFVMEASYVLGNGTFGNGPYSHVLLSLQVNFAPRLSLAGKYSFDEDTVFEMNLNDFVIDEDHADATLTWTITGGQNISSTRLPGNLARFTPAPNWVGAEAFTFTARDPLGASDTARVSMEVLAVQDRPSAAQLLSPIGDARVDTLNVSLQWRASVDPDGEALSYLVIFGTVRTLTAQVDSGRTSNTAFTIPNDFIKPGRRYYWQVVAFDGFTPSVPSAIDSFRTIPSTGVAEREAGALQFDLAQNYPNPFSLRGGANTTMIRFSLPEPSFVVLEIYNALGQKIASLRQAQMPAGRHEVAWKGVDDMGKKISSGIYWINFSAGAFQSLRKIVATK